MENSLIIAFMVQSIWYTMFEGEIFGRIGEWFKKYLPPVIHNPVFECPVCMVPWYGTAIYLTLFEGPFYWKTYIITIIAAMGINVVINELKPKPPLPPEIINYEDSERDSDETRTKAD